MTDRGDYNASILATESIIPLHRRSRDVPWLVPVLAALFFCSGASALIYQVIWLRQLGLVFGVTAYAASTVWAGFMTGLALGSLAAGRIADPILTDDRPLTEYFLSLPRGRDADIRGLKGDVRPFIHP